MAEPSQRIWEGTFWLNVLESVVVAQIVFSLSFDTLLRRTGRMGGVSCP
jgi:hypothetical protein